MGVPIKWRGGEYGWISSWQHPACLRVSDVSREQLAREIHGLDQLSPEHRDLVLDELTSEEAVQLEEIDPDDPAHCKPAGPIPRLPTPAALSRPLLSFQEEGLGWMVANEAGPLKGGILADEMGMGKTIQTISLLLHAKSERAARAVASAERGEALARAERPAPTLVVVPTSALPQWEDEIRDCTLPGSLRVLVYYANRKSLTKEAIEAVDVVLTTYPVVEAEWRKIINRAMVACEYCGKKLLPRSLVTHKKYFCGPDAVRTAKLAKREKKRDVANEKAMRTLKIKSGKAEDVVEALPTPSNFYRELMTKAGRPAMSMYDGAIKARRNPKNGAADAESDDDSDVVFVSETPGKSSGSEPGDEMLRAAIQASLRDEENRLRRERAKDAEGLERVAGRRRATKGANAAKVKAEGDAPNGVALRAAADAAVTAFATKAEKKRTTRRSASVKSTRGGEAESDEVEDEGDEDWTPAKAREDQDAQIARAVALEDDEGDAAGGESPAPSSPLPPSEEDIDLSDSLLHAVEWERVVLDEAHKIKARTTNTAKCIYALRSTHKWCLTGTPLQNRVGELYSLVRFLRMDPHAYYFCKVKGCECKSLCWNFGPEQRACSACGHAGPRHYSHFNQTVINPINRYGYVGDGRKGFLTLRNDILLPAQLRRTKTERSADVKLPPLTIDIRETEMNEVERDFYESLYMLTRAKFDGYVKKGSVLHNYAHIFELLSRLRQACDHPYLVLHSKSAPSTGEVKTEGVAGGFGGGDDEGGEEKDGGCEGKVGGKAKGKGKRASGELSEDPELEATAGTEEPKYYCGMCQDEVDPDDAALAGCKHVFHRECIAQYAACAPARGEKVTCPACRAPLTIDLQPADLTGAARTVPSAGKRAPRADELPSKSILSRVDLSRYTSSTKVESLVEGLRDMRAEKDGHLNKAIVFSQYTNMLDIVEWRLKKEGFVVAKLVGSMPVVQRAANLRAFREDPAVGVILMSLKSGGEGLNLQAANRVFVLEPWWNPAVEMQAVMRAHRIGQKRAVIATRFSTKDTIEERMMQLQEKKRLVFEGCMDGNQAALAQLTEEDLQFLFKR